MKYAFIEVNQQLFSITRMCRVLDVSSSSYYDWMSRNISEQQIRRNQCELLVRVAHTETKQRYGVERLHSHLRAQGHHISQYMIRSLKEEHGIKCRRHKRFKVTTNSNHNASALNMQLNNDTGSLRNIVKQEVQDYFRSKAKCEERVAMSYNDALIAYEQE